MWVKVEIPFIDKKTKKLQERGKKLNISAERLAEIRAINVNMVSVIDTKE